MTMMNLLEKIKNHSAQIGVIGMGYVGLPLALQFAAQKFKVTGFDTNSEVVDNLNNCKSHVDDVSLQNLKQHLDNKHFHVENKIAAYAGMDVLIVCVPTPLTKHKDPDMSYIHKASQAIAENLKKGQLIVLESTTFPGTTTEVVKPILDQSGLKLNQDYFLAFSPERIDPGNAKFNVSNTPKIVGGAGTASLELAKTLYEQIIPQVHVVSSPEAAEMTKLLENIFRSVNIALVNEMALLCGKLNIDIWEVIDAAATKPYGFMPFYPGPGIGGHCIPLDPFYLSWKAKEYNFYSRFIELAGEINDQMPHFIVSKINSALNSQKKSINGSKILVLGASYKKDIGDVRESPSLTIIKDLMKKQGQVSYHDSFVPHLQHEGIDLSSVPFSDQNIKASDVVVILTNHSQIDYQHLTQTAALIVDARNAISDRSFKHVFRL